MKRAAMVAVAALLLGHAGVARADVAMRAVLQAQGGFTVGGGDGAVEFGGHAAVVGGVALGDGPTRPYVAAGLYGGTGVLRTDDVRALDGTLELTYWTGGPQVRAGLRFGDATFASSLYVSGTVLFTALDERLAYDAVAAVEDAGPGVRGALGIDYGHWVRASHTVDHNDDAYVSSDDKAAAVLAYLLPTYAEFTVTHNAGSTRYGASLGWGF